MIKVVAALIEKDNKYLIAKRSTGDTNTHAHSEYMWAKIHEILNAPVNIRLARYLITHYSSLLKLP